MAVNELCSNTEMSPSVFFRLHDFVSGGIFWVIRVVFDKFFGIYELCLSEKYITHTMYL